MSLKHNKKRNAALIYEQLIRYISRSLIEGRYEKASYAKKVLSEHYARGTELYKEFRLFNSILRTQVDDSTARRIVIEARRAAGDHNPEKLEKEKGRLISSINRDLNESSLYDMRIPEYRDLATIQLLLNSWRSPNKVSPSEVVQLEEKVVDILKRQKSTPPLVVSEGVNPLSLKIAKQKFIQNSSSNLTPEQIMIISLSAKGNSEALVPMLRSIKESTLNRLKVLKLNETSEIILSKVGTVTEAISNLSFEDTSSENVSKFLVLNKLCDEIAGGKNE